MLIQKGPQTDAQKTLYGDKPLDSQMASICPMFSMMPFSRGYDKDNFPRLAGSRTSAQRCRRESNFAADIETFEVRKSVQLRGALPKIVQPLSRSKRYLVPYEVRPIPTFVSVLRFRFPDNLDATFRGVRAFSRLTSLLLNKHGISQ